MKFCGRPGCGVIVARGYCPAHQPRRPVTEMDRLYQDPRWRELRARALRRMPRCPGRGDGLPCGARTVDVDHRVPHRGDPVLFFDEGNLDAYCHRCHAAKTGRGL